MISDMKTNRYVFACFLIFSVVLLAACSSIKSKEAMHESDAVQARSFDADERLVLTGAIESFSIDQGCTGATGSGVFLDLMSVSADRFFTDEYLHYYLPGELWASIGPLVVDLRRKNDTNYSLDWTVQPKFDFRVVDLNGVEGAALLELEHSSNCILSFMLPAFSVNREHSLVVFFVTPSEHGTVEIYILEKDAGRWLVTGKKALEFL